MVRGRENETKMLDKSLLKGMVVQREQFCSIDRDTRWYAAVSMAHLCKRQILLHRRTTTLKSRDLDSNSVLVSQRQSDLYGL